MSRREFDDASDRANAAVQNWLIKRYREDGDNEHLRACPDIVLKDVEGSDGQYGCDTGREYVRLEAEVSCPHGEQEADFCYGEFGDLADLLESVLHDEGASEAMPETKRVGWSKVIIGGAG